MNKATIINLALSTLGASTSVTATFGQNVTKIAESGELWYDHIRRKSLIDIIPNFAIQRRVVSKLTTSKPFGFANSYDRPADALRVLGIGEADSQFQEFNDEGGTIDTDLDQPNGLQLRIVVDEEDMNKADANFIDYLVAHMAHALVAVVTSDEQRREVMRRSLKERMGDVMAIQAQNNPPIRVSTNRFRQARLTGGVARKRKK